MKSPKISLCMIVRDEAQSLARCLASSREAADEIVIVDTGSKDDTMSIAREAGAKVFERPWTDHFSQARNRAIEEATGDWILILDADETLAPGSCAALREASRIGIAGGFLLHLSNLADDGRKLDDIMLMRFFRNHPSVRYQGRIHEQVTETLNAFVTANRLKIAPCDARIVHTGYRDGEMARKGKRERNERLFRLHLEEFPRDAYGWFKYAGFLGPFAPERSKEALLRSQEILVDLPAEEAKKLVWGAEVAARVAFAKLHEGSPAEALEILRVAAQRHTATPNFVFALGCIALKNAQHAMALHSFRTCLGFQGQAFQVGVEPGITGPIAHYGMGEAYKGLGEKENAAEQYRRALALLPGYAQAQAALEEISRSESRC